MKVNSNDSKKIPPLLRESWNRLNCIFMERVKKVGLTPDQFSALRWTFSKPKNSLTQSELSALMSTDRNNISSLVKRMEVMGLIERKTLSEDQRRKIINLTPKGKIMFKKGKAIANQLENEVLSSLDANEKKRLFEALKKLASNLGEKN